MAVADGISVVENAKELRVKESDRISTILEGLIGVVLRPKSLVMGMRL